MPNSYGAFSCIGAGGHAEAFVGLGPKLSKIRSFRWDRKLVNMATAASRAQKMRLEPKINPDNASMAKGNRKVSALPSWAR